MLCGSMLERVIICCIEVVNVTKIEIQDGFLYLQWGYAVREYVGESVDFLYRSSKCYKY